ncbi:MAG: hypothetical protein IKH21_00575 [Clostridia bacterium]|nr:hypothetical protein [Clostridia bacterium]
MNQLSMEYDIKKTPSVLCHILRELASRPALIIKRSVFSLENGGSMYRIHRPT